MPRKFSFQEPESSRGAAVRADSGQAEEVFASLLFAPARSHASAPAAAAASAGPGRSAPARPRGPPTHKLARALTQSHISPQPAPAPGRSPLLHTARSLAPPTAQPPAGHEQAFKSSFFASGGGGGGGSFAKAASTQSARLRELDAVDHFDTNPTDLAIESIDTTEQWASRNTASRSTHVGTSPPCAAASQAGAARPAAPPHHYPPAAPARQQSLPRPPPPDSRASNESASSTHSMQYSFRSRSERASSAALTHARQSADSRSTAPTARSSFALERPAVSQSQPSLDVFGPAASSRIVPSKVSASAALLLKSLPDPIKECTRVFAVLSQQSLVPLAMLSRVWRCDDAYAMAVVEKLAQRGIIRYATLKTSAVWCVANTTYSTALRHIYKGSLVAITENILASYEGDPAFPGWADLPDDGFIMLHVVGMLGEVGRLDDMRQLLVTPGWLEQKMHWHGAAAVVKDFHTALDLDAPFVPTAKLLLQAFKMAEGTTLATKQAGTLGAQMLARTQAVSKLSQQLVDKAFKDWWEDQSEQLQEAARASFDHARATAELGGVAPKGDPPPPVHLLPETATMAQACGSTRLVLRGHNAPVVKAMMTEDMLDIVSIGADGSLRVWDLEVGTCSVATKPGKPYGHLHLAGPGRALIISRASPRAVLMHPKGPGDMMRLDAESPISACLVHPKGSTALLGTESGEIRMFSLADGVCELIMASHNAPVTALAVCWSVCGAFDGPVAVSGATDGSVKAWSLMADTGEPPLAELEGHGGAISTLVLYGRGARCAAASHDGAAIIWDVASGARLSALVGGGGRMTTLIIEPRLERFALTATDDGGAAVWSLDGSVRRVAPLRGLTSYITAGAFLPSYRRGAGAPDDLADRTLVATAGGDGAVAVWDCMSGQRLRLLSGHCEEVLSLDVSAKGRFLLTSSADGTCRVWDLHSNVIEPPVPHLGGVQGALALGASGLVLTCGHDASLALWDGERLSPSTFGLAARATALHTPIVMHCSPDGALVATCAANRHVCVWDVETLEPIRTMAALPGSRVKSASFSGDCNLMAVVLFDSTITLWDVTREEAVWQPQARGVRDASLVHAGGVNACALSQAGNLLVTISKDCTSRLWNVVTRQPITVLRGHKESVCCQWLHPSASLLLTGSEDGTVRAWNPQKCSTTMILTHKLPISSVTASKDCKHALTACRSKSAWLWNLETGACTKVLRAKDKAVILSGTFSDDSALLITHHDTASVAVWSSCTGALVAYFACDSTVRHVACTPQGAVALGTHSGLVHFLRLPAPEAGAVGAETDDEDEPVPHVVEAVGSSDDELP